MTDMSHLSRQTPDLPRNTRGREPLLPRPALSVVVVLWLIMVGGPPSLWSQERSVAVEFLPDTRIFPRFTADALTHQISLSHVTENRDWIGTIGASVPIIGVTTPSNGDFQFSIAASTFNRLIKPPHGLTVYTIDYKVDFPFDYKIGTIALRFGYGHYSCHFADDGIELLGKHSIQYIKDGLSLGGSYDIAFIGGYVYAMAQYNYHISPLADKRWQLQLGAECGNLRLSDFARFYAAVDVKSKQDVSWGTTQSYQAGVKLFEKGNRDLRVAYTLRTGFEERGQFFNQEATVNLLSLFVDL